MNSVSDAKRIKHERLKIWIPIYQSIKNSESSMEMQNVVREYTFEDTVVTTVIGYWSVLGMTVSINGVIALNVRMIYGQDLSGVQVLRQELQLEVNLTIAFGDISETRFVHNFGVFTG